MEGCAKETEGFFFWLIFTTTCSGLFPVCVCVSLNEGEGKRKVQVLILAVAFAHRVM